MDRELIQLTIFVFGLVSISVIVWNMGLAIIMGMKEEQKPKPKNDETTSLE